MKSLLENSKHFLVYNIKTSINHKRKDNDINVKS